MTDKITALMRKMVVVKPKGQSTWSGGVRAGGKGLSSTFSSKNKRRCVYVVGCRNLQALLPLWSPYSTDYNNWNLLREKGIPMVRRLFGKWNVFGTNFKSRLTRRSSVCWLPMKERSPNRWSPVAVTCDDEFVLLAGHSVFRTCFPEESLLAAGSRSAGTLPRQRRCSSL